VIFKIKLLLHTIRYLKPIQIRYQIWYRLKNKFVKLHWYKTYLEKDIIKLDSELKNLLILSKCKYLKNNTFQFLNLKQTFQYRVDWNFMGHGKLWNYNLQYFDFLHDEAIELSERINLLEDYSKQLIDNVVKPEPYPVSLRIINTLFFLGENNIKNLHIELALKYQIDYLRNNLEYHILANHYLENIYALFIASIALNDASLYNKAEYLLREQLEEQILNDGGHYECTPMYHSILFSKLLLCIELASNQHYCSTILPFLRETASRMLGWIERYSFPDGSWAMFNDATNSIAHTAEDLITSSDNLVINPTKIQLQDSGYRKISGNNWDVIVDVGNIIPSYQPGHAHADIFSFCLWHFGNELIIDTGISTYNNNRQRQLERCTESHNTVVVEGDNQSEVWSGFRVGRRASVEIILDSSDAIVAQHNGYKKYGLTHKRKFLKDSDQSFTIQDDIISNKTNTNLSTRAIFYCSNINTRQLIKNSLYADHVSIEFSNHDDIIINQVEVANGYNSFKQVYKIEVAFTNTLITKFSF